MSDTTPIRLDYQIPPPVRPRRPLALVGIAISTMLAGMLVGASTNAINGAVSPTYFVSVMGWSGGPGAIWTTSIAQGVLEGSIAGFVLSIVLSMTIGIISRATCEWTWGLRWLGRIVLAVYALWFIGGLLGVSLAASAPSFFHASFIGVPADRAQMLRYAWVGGSIWGAYFGGPSMVIVGVVFFQVSWRRRLKRDADARASASRMDVGA